MSYNQEMGKWGEQIAFRYLQEQEFKVLERNYFTRYGEIDIICLRGNVLVFVEVKTRHSTLYGMPEDSITERKREHLVNAALLYLADHTGFEEWEFDLITVEGSLNSIAPVITHFRNAIID